MRSEKLFKQHIPTWRLRWFLITLAKENIRPWWIKAGLVFQGVTVIIAVATKALAEQLKLGFFWITTRQKTKGQKQEKAPNKLLMEKFPQLFFHDCFSAPHPCWFSPLLSFCGLSQRCPSSANLQAGGHQPSFWKRDQKSPIPVCAVCRHIARCQAAWRDTHIPKPRWETVHSLKTKSWL